MATMSAGRAKTRTADVLQSVGDPALAREPADEAPPSKPAPSSRAVLVSLAPESNWAAAPPVVIDSAGGEVVVDGTRSDARLELRDAESGLLATARSGSDGTVRVRLLPAMRGRTVPAGVQRREVIVDGWRVLVDLEPAARAALRERARRGNAASGHSGPSEVRAMIPGVVLAVAVGADDEVEAGQVLVVVEAMKMQNEIRAPRDGRVDRVAVQPGTKIEVGDLLVVLAGESAAQ